MMASDGPESATSEEQQPPRSPEDAGEGEEDMPLSQGKALRLAWTWWVLLLLIPFGVFIVIVWLYMAGATPEPRPGVSMGFFVASLLWLLVSVPLTFLWRNYVFKAYWENRPVEPRSYLRGMITIWLAPEIGGLIALAGCWASGQWMPGLLPAALAFVLFTPFWPTGQAMSAPVGGEEDDEFFRYPR